MPTKKTPKKPAAALKGDYLAQVQAKLEKAFGSDSAIRLGKGRATAGAVREVVPTGIEVVDHYLAAIGGLPAGRVTEVSGAEGSGKTSFAYGVEAAAQRDGATVFVVDAEQAFDEDRARTVFGVDTDNLLIGQPLHLAIALEQIKVVVGGHDPKRGLLLVVLDSLAGSATKAELNGEAGDRQVAEVARLMSTELKVIIPLLVKHRAHLLVVNQLRDKPGVMFGPKSDTPGGRGLKFYSSLRLQLFGGKAIKDAKTEQHTGKIITFVTTKTRFSAPFRKARVRLDYATGWNNDWSTLEHAKTAHLVPKDAKGPKAATAARLALGWAPGQTPAPAQGLVESGTPPDEEE